MSEQLPYLSNPSMINSVLKKIQPAQTPDKFDATFLQEKLGLKGGGFRSFIPFAKRIGLLTPDGAPTDLYKQFRIQGHSSAAIARAMQIGYKQLYASHEKAHELPPNELKGLIIQITGKEEKSSAVGQIVACFNKLKEWAKFNGETAITEDDEATEEEDKGRETPSPRKGRLNIAYTINLNLPESSNPAVFNAIFKALKENMLREDEL